MSLVEEYYELNEAEEVSVVWKVFSILFYGCAATFGLMCGFTMALLRMKFDDKCYLFTDLRQHKREDENVISWESDSWCDFYQFSMVSSFIVGIIWGTFFLMCGKGGKSLTGLPQPWRIAWPTLVFNLIFFLITLSCAISIQKGTDIFCRGDTLPKSPTKSLVRFCDTLNELLQQNEISKAVIQIDMVVKTGWVCASSWLVLFVISSLRIVLVVDFNLYKVCVFKLGDTIQNKKEEVLRITNYEEPKKLYFGDDEGRTLDPGITAKDSESKRKMKNDRKLMRQQLNISKRLPHKPNAIFYETTDIRLLTREKKRVKSTSQELDEAFGKTAANLGFGLRKTIQLQSESDASANFELPTLLHQYSADLYYDDDDYDDEDESSSSTLLQRPEDSNESESGTEVYSSNRSLRSKKRI